MTSGVLHSLPLLVANSVSFLLPVGRLGAALSAGHVDICPDSQEGGTSKTIMQG